MVVCGLPTLRANLLRARTYSERMFRGEEIGRLAATEALGTAPPPARLELGLRMLGDRVRSVRFAALEALVSLGRPPIPSAHRSAFDAVVAEYVHAQRIHAERA